MGSLLIVCLSLASFYWSTLTPLFRRLSPAYRMFSFAGFLLTYSGFPFLLMDHTLPETSSQLDKGPIICGILFFVTALLIFLVIIALLLYNHITRMKGMRNCLQGVNYRYFGHWVNNSITLGSVTAYFSLGYFFSPTTIWGYASVSFF